MDKPKPPIPAPDDDDGPGPMPDSTRSRGWFVNYEAPDIAYDSDEEEPPPEELPDDYATAYPSEIEPPPEEDDYFYDYGHLFSPSYETVEHEVGVDPGSRAVDDDGGTEHAMLYLPSDKASTASTYETHGAEMELGRLAFNYNRYLMGYGTSSSSGTSTSDPFSDEPLADRDEVIRHGAGMPPDGS